MNRKILAVAALLLAALTSNAAVIFQDDFSNPGTSSQNWSVSNPDQLTKSFAGGELSATNNDTDYGVLLIHELANLPSVFTFSAKVNRTSDKSAGLYFCLGTSGTKVTGYELTVSGSSQILVWKHKSDTPVLAFQGQSAYMVSGYNEIIVSRNGNKFNIFCNSQVVGTFTDSDITSGHIALELGAGAAAKFDDVVLTDQFQEASVRTCFADNFDDGNVIGWFIEGKGQVENKNNSLVITTLDSSCNLVTDLGLVNFNARVVVSHRNGSKNSSYGLYLQGRSQGKISLAGFVITGSRMYGTFTPLTTKYELYSSQKIKGAAYIEDGQTYYFNDTLEVSKQQSTGYIFKVNTFPLCTIPTIGFEITDIGLYCTDSLNLIFDDFIAAEGTDLVCQDGPISVSQKQVNRKIFNSTKAQYFIIDPLGRTISNFEVLEFKRHISPGLFIQAGKRKTMVGIEP